MNKTAIITILQTKKEELQTRFGLEKLALFGSFSRDEATQDSDMDILFELKESTTFSLFDYLKLNKMLEETLEHKVDLVREAKLKDALKPYVYKDIIYV